MLLAMYALASMHCLHLLACIVYTCWCALFALANVHLLVFAMTPLMFLNNFKFKYFFGVQVLAKNLVPPILNFCDVLQQHK
jgi:hypothetical protein